MTGGKSPEGGAQTTKPARRHDLDALRGFAMVLGIALHAVLSFLPGFWPARDDTAGFAGPYDEILHAIHGFRMPLFFLLSGFFTTMLWRRRGLQALLWHRFRRIAMPLALGILIIIPAVNASSEWAFGNGVSDYLDESGDVWAAVALGDHRAVEELLDRGIDVNAPDEDEHNTPLHIAAVVDEVEIAELLLARGADPNARSDEGTPMSYAVFFGNAAVAEVLAEAGAPDPRPAGGDWEDISYWDVGGDLLVREDRLGLTTWLTSFHHLWFLWFLLWLVAGFALIAMASDRLGRPREHPARWTGWIMWALVPITLIPQLAMGNRGATPTFGPDTSSGLIPLPHVLAYYTVFFAFGALLYGRRNRGGEMLVDRIGRWWAVFLPVTLIVVLPLALRLTFDIVDRSWRLASIAQVVYAWGMIVALMGAFRALLAKERRGVRYLSDSSYWLYLAHVPLVILAQSWIRHWALPSGLKFGALTVVISGFLLATYQLLVRYSPIGTLLNGKRVRPPRKPRKSSGGA